VDEHRDSLAHQAAAWVPPWVREPAPDAEPEPHSAAADSEPAPTLDAEQMPEPGREAEPAREAEAEPDREAEVEPEREPEAEPAGTAADDPSSVTPSAGEPVPDGGASESAIGGDAPGVPSPKTAAPAEPAPIDEAELHAALEAILLVVDEPVTDVVLAGVLEQPTWRVAGALTELSTRYTTAGHGFDLRRAAGGWRLYTRPEYADYVERFILDGQQARLTQAALETLAVIAYKQPVTRSRISAIRGVNCDGVIRTLTGRGLVAECGTEPETGAYLYRTTTLFLEKLGLDSVAELPSLAPFLPDDVEEIADAQR
jgi:segregation and condensation protein B